MRLVHVAPRFPPAEGGGERHAARLAEALARRGHQVTVLTTKLRSEVPRRLDPALPDREAFGAVRVERLPVRPTGLPMWGYGYTVPTLAAQVRDLAPDVVHLHGYGYAAGDAVARLRRRGAPWALVMTSHGFLPGRGPLRPLKTLYDATLGRWTAGTLDAAIAIAPRDAAVFEGLGARRVTVVPNGVEYDRFASAAPDPALLARLGLREQGYVLGLGRLERLKGPDLLLDAFAEVARWHPELKLVLAGEGTLEGPLRHQAARLGLAERVVLPGRVADDAAAALLRGARLFAHAARDEPFGIVLLEAMAAGAPVLATDVGGIPFATGGAALLVPPGRAALAHGLARLLQEEDLRADLAKRGRAHARALSWDANAARVEAVYRMALEARGAAGARRQS